MAEIHEEVSMMLDRCREQIVSNMAKHYSTINGERWVNASGRSAAAFRVEVSEDHVRLVYSGSDIAPLESIENGSDVVPSVEEAARWRRDKMASGAANLPSAEGIVKSIATNGGTERKRNPQTWIVSQPVDDAEFELGMRLAGLATIMVNELLYDGGN